MITGTSELRIGENTWIGNESFISATAKICIGSNVDIAPQVYIRTGTHEIDEHGDHSAGKGLSSPITIADGVWIGARAVILPGVTVNNKAVVAAGAVVNKAVAARCVVAGVPARPLRKF